MREVSGRIARAGFGLVVALCCLAMLGGCGGRRSTQQRNLGDTHFRLGNIPQALDAYEKALKADPGNVAARLGVARCRRVQGEPEASLVSYREALARDPSLDIAYLEAVDVLLGLERAEEARELASQCASVNPETGGVLLARIDLATGRTEEAIAYLKELSGELRESAPVQVMLAKALLDANELGEAETLLTDVLADLDPDSLAARMELIEVYRRQGKLPEIVTQLEQLVEQRPDNHGMKLALARALLASGRFDEAEAMARPVLEERPESGWANFVVGCCLIRQDDFDDAVACLQTAVRALPHEKAAADMLAIAQAGGDLPVLAQRPEGAVPGEAVEDEPEWRGLWRTADLHALIERRESFLAQGEKDVREALVLAAVFLERMELAEELAGGLDQNSPVRAYVGLLPTGDMGAVLDHFEGWQETDAFRKELRANAKGFVLGLGGARAAALREFSECLATWRGHGVALYNAATMFGRARMPEFQANCLASLVRMHPKNVQNHTLLFRAFLAAGMENEARRQAELTYAIYPEHPAALRNLAHAYRLAGDLELAEDVLGRAIDAAPEDSSLCLELADLLVDAGDYQRARELISDTAVSEEMRTQANSIAAFAAALEGEWTPALELWNDVRHVGPVPAIRLLCSAALAQAGRADDAAAALTADRDGEPLATVSETPAMLAEALRGWKAPGPLLEGASDLGRALADNRTALVDYALGAACLRAGYFTAGLTVLQELDASLGGHPGLAAPILRALARARVADARIGAGEAIVDRYPEVSAAWQAFASLCEMEGDPARQQLALEKAVETGPDQFPAWYALAVYRTEREDFQQAEEAFRRLLELAPDHPAVQNNLAYCILQTGGDVNEALDFARAAVDKLGANAHAVHTLGLAQLRAGEHEEARKHLAVALEMRPGDPTLLLDYGRALIALGRDDEGKLHVRSAILYADQMGLDFPRRAEAEQVLANGPAA